MKTTSPHALIVDDDAITLRFFDAAFHDLGWSCSLCADAATAMSACENVDLLVLDRHLPDMRGDRLLRALREKAVTAPAIATSAEVDANVRDQLIAAGFDEVIAKPISLDALRAVLMRYHAPPMTMPALLDDAGALNALGGNRDGLRALRNLLADELTQLQTTHADVERIDLGDFHGRLHRLRASCGFCGATGLSDAATALQQHLRETPKPTREDFASFFDLCATTATALRAPPSES